MKLNPENIFVVINPSMNRVVEHLKNYNVKIVFKMSQREQLMLFYALCLI